MLQLIQNKYKVLLEQGFLPILVADGVDALFEVEAAVNAGFKAVEFTLRRPDARVMIPEIRKRFPDLLLLVGSVLDAPKVVKNLQHKNPQLMLVEELADCGVDGLVSMLDFSDETIAKYQNQMLLMPAAATPAEGLRLFEKGVHFIKVITPYLPTINSLTAAPSFNFAPLLVTGGMNLETIPDMVSKKVPLIASGFEVVANGRADALTSDKLSQKLVAFKEITCTSREKAFPGIAATLIENRLKDLPWALPVNWEI
jgi:2-keto-3-deoxy-6-phosphogluconate aldolase